MNSETNDTNINRRHFLTAGAAGIAAAGVGLHSPEARAAGAKAPPTNSRTGIRTAVITDAQLNIGPYLAREFARLNYNLVIADVRKGLPDELRSLGAAKVVEVPGIEQEAPNHEGRPGVIQKVVDAAMNEFGGFDSAFIRTALHHPPGDILETTGKGLFQHYEQNCLAVMYALQAVLPPAPKGVCVNVIGTNFMNYPGFREAAGAEDDAVYQNILKEIPMRRLGETEEAAHLALALLDGYNMYTTGNFIPVAGGFNNVGMEPFGA
jgi:NAD(P)-dependent dehydrogenase (short-subunit alcohol dehydrogenase family)